MAKKLIAKSPIGYAGHLLSPGDNVREYIHDKDYIALLIERGHAEEVEVVEKSEAPVETQEVPEPEALKAEEKTESPAADTEDKPEAPAETQAQPEEETPVADEQLPEDQQSETPVPGRKRK